MRPSDLEALGIAVTTCRELPAGIVAFATAAGLTVLDLRPHRGQFAEAAPFSGDAAWPLRCAGLPFDWKREMHAPRWELRRV